MTNDNVIRDKLENARRDLLDLTTRNRLLHTPRNSSRSGRLEIVDELTDQVLRILVQQKKVMTFLHGQPNESDEDHAGVLDQPEAEEFENGIAARHLDSQLQTSLTSDGLQRKLLQLYYDARTFEEEQGVNILYLAVGFLKWYEDDQSDRERQAPLLLVPVQLDRSSAVARFRLRYTEEEITTNLSLQEKLKVEFGIQLPDVPDLDEFRPSDYFAQVQQAIDGQSRWELLPDDMVLWFFSFSKFLMYRDLQPEAWPGERQIENQPVVQALLDGGFRNEAPICGSDDRVDDILQPLDMIHVMDADSSQTIAIEEVKRGRNLVIQGPPGTGKSQTITNLIATAVKEGKKVLFVAEKMAALEVVKRRLDNIGLGDMCLELHSHRTNKRSVLEELARTLSLGQPKVEDVHRHAAELISHRDKLNQHADVMHSYLEPAHVTPFRALGELVRLRAAGIKPADFALVDPLTWSSTDLQEKQNILRDLAVHMQQVGNPVEHPWRGVQLEAALPTDIDRLSNSLPPIMARIDRVQAAATDLATTLQQRSPATLLDVSTLAQWGQRVVKAPPLDRGAIADEVWGRRRQDIDQLLVAGKQLAHCRQTLKESVVEAGWSTDVTKTRRDLAAHGRSLFRIFNSDYRQAQATLRGIVAGAPPKLLDDRLAILDQLIQGRKCLRLLETDESGDKVGRHAFGDKWRGANSDWNELETIADWVAECRSANVPDNFLNVVAQVDDPMIVGQQIRRIAKDLQPLAGELRSLFKQLRLDLEIAFGSADSRTVSLAQLKQRMEAWQKQMESVTKWIAYFTRWKRLESQGMGELAKRLDGGWIAATEALDQFQMAYFEDLMREAFRRYPELAAFNGVSHENILASFKEQDSERLILARQEVASAHFRGLPTAGGDAGEVGILRREMKKKRRHLPLRKLMQQAGHAVQAIKPVMMMSPVSVAQYLEPGVLEYDLLLIDEASQIRPVDALGAIARAKQLVVVGDDRQLPPTRFFSKVLGDQGEADEADDFQAGDMESILGLCEAQNMPQRMLKWHYRSRHHSLIAVSNREFYDDKLFVVPSPFSHSEKMGLKFRHVIDGCFDRGGAAHNLNEAKALADAVMQHAKRYPDKTLGVGAFSVAQRDAILSELELRRRETPEREPFFVQGGAEPFFVKNLENIQGDERDVIFISVGYGRDESGYMAMSFGPLNNDGGERRLNVLISRAKERCEVFSSITADDIDLNRSKARGVQSLKSFLTYAESGILGVAEPTGGSFDSEFERQVAKALGGYQYELECQVGVAGFFVDLAVVDPDCPGRYLIGIECDGANYHSSRSARDRDRLRQQVLEDRGWIIHRIWSTDWFHRPEEQLRKLIASIEAAKATWAARANSSGSASQATASAAEDILRIDRHEHEANEEIQSNPIETVPYVEADFPVNTSEEIHALPPEQLAQVVSQIVKIEGPVHQEEITRRVASIWGLARAGRRIADAVDAALSEAAYREQVNQNGLFFRPSDQETVPIRNRAMVKASNLRKPDYLPPEEIRSAIEAVVVTHLGVSVSDVAPEVARLFGFRNTSAQLRHVIEEEIRFLQQQTRLEERSNRLYTSEETQQRGVHS